MKTSHILVLIATFLFSIIFMNCGTNQSSVGAVSSVTNSYNFPDELDMILREVSDYLNESIPAGRKIAIINVQSGSTALTEYVIDELISNAVNDRIFSVVDRQQLDTVRAELNFNMSGEVSDQSAQSVGQMLGAQTIITGRITQIGERFRLNIRALEVETVQVQGSNNWNIAAGATITALMRGAGGGVTVGTQTATARQAGQTTQPTTQPQIDIITPLTTGTAVPGDNLADKFAWLQRSADSHNTYILEITSDENIAPHTFNYSGAINITIVIRGDQENRTIRLRSNGTMFTVNANVNFILENNITLHGHNGNRGPMVKVNGGTFIMRNGSTITGNTNALAGVGSDGGGAVYISAGTFEMTGGSISGNTASDGGGVLFDMFGARGRTFTMSGGTISGNIASENGGGVCLSGGLFNMTGGTISGNTASNGGGVYSVNGNVPTFNMRGGIITGNTATSAGGGVYASATNTEFTKTGGIVTGYNSDQNNGNVVRDGSGVLARSGHAVAVWTGYNRPYNRRETTVGSGVNLSASSRSGWDN